LTVSHCHQPDSHPKPLLLQRLLFPSLQAPLCNLRSSLLLVPASRIRNHREPERQHCVAHCRIGDRRRRRQPLHDWTRSPAPRDKHGQPPVHVDRRSLWRHQRSLRPMTWPPLLLSLPKQGQRPIGRPTGMDVRPRLRAGPLPLCPVAVVMGRGTHPRAPAGTPSHTPLLFGAGQHSAPESGPEDPPSASRAH
jgi:hypothetical protein